MTHRPDPADYRGQILEGRTTLGIEFGSTRIKACLVGDDPSIVLATGEHDWVNHREGGHWTYSLEQIEQGLQAAYAALSADAFERYGARPATFGALGISAMMHGYLAFDSAEQLLVPFRTWRDTTTVAAAGELTELFGVNIPLRWSIAHLHQALLDGEAHVPEVATLTTLAGYVHWRLTGRKVLGIGDASGMFPIDSATGGYDERMLDSYDERAGGRLAVSVRDLLPAVLSAGATAGELTVDGAAFLDPTGTVLPGAQLCPPEGDAGTGMVATNSVKPRTGNVSVGTSVFAMVVLERALSGLHHEIDLVTTPEGDPVAMVHCNNGASEVAAWIGLFVRFAEASHLAVDPDDVFATLFTEALAGETDAGGLVALGHLAGEPIVGLAEGRPLFMRTPDSEFSLANFMRAQLYGMFGTLAVGFHVLEREGVSLDRIFAHGGVFRTKGVAQRFLAAALHVPVAVGDLASEGGAWGIALLASYVRHADEMTLSEYLDSHVFASAGLAIVEPTPDDVAGFAAYLDRYRAAIAVEVAAVHAL